MFFARISSTRKPVRLDYDLQIELSLQGGEGLKSFEPAGILEQVGSQTRNFYLPELGEVKIPSEAWEISFCPQRNFNLVE